MNFDVEGFKSGGCWMLWCFSLAFCKSSMETEGKQVQFLCAALQMSYSFKVDGWLNGKKGYFATRFRQLWICDQCHTTNTLWKTSDSFVQCYRIFFSDLFKPICCLFKQNKSQVTAFHIGIIMAGISKIEQLFSCTERASNQDTNAFKLCCIITFNSCRIHLLRFKSDI